MDPEPFQLATQVLGPLPVINAFCDRLGLGQLLETCLPHDDRRCCRVTIWMSGGGC